MPPTGSPSTSHSPSQRSTASSTQAPRRAPSTASGNIGSGDHTGRLLRSNGVRQPRASSESGSELQQTALVASPPSVSRPTRGSVAPGSSRGTGAGPPSGSPTQRRQPMSTPTGATRGPAGSPGSTARGRWRGSTASTRNPRPSPTRNSITPGGSCEVSAASSTAAATGTTVSLSPQAMATLPPEVARDLAPGGSPATSPCSSQRSTASPTQAPRRVPSAAAGGLGGGDHTGRLLRTNGVRQPRASSNESASELQHGALVPSHSPSPQSLSRPTRGSVAQGSSRGTGGGPPSGSPTQRRPPMSSPTGATRDPAGSPGGTARGPPNVRPGLRKPPSAARDSNGPRGMPSKGALCRGSPRPSPGPSPTRTPVTTSSLEVAAAAAAAAAAASSTAAPAATTVSTPTLATCKETPEVAPLAQSVSQPSAPVQGPLADTSIAAGTAPGANSPGNGSIVASAASSASAPVAESPRREANGELTSMPSLVRLGSGHLVRLPKAPEASLGQPQEWLCEEPVDVVDCPGSPQPRRPDAGYESVPQHTSGLWASDPVVQQSQQSAPSRTGSMTALRSASPVSSSVVTYTLPAATISTDGSTLLRSPGESSTLLRSPGDATAGAAVQMRAFEPPARQAQTV